MFKLISLNVCLIYNHTHLRIDEHIYYVAITIGIQKIVIDT